MSLFKVMRADFLLFLVPMKKGFLLTLFAVFSIAVAFTGHVRAEYKPDHWEVGVRSGISLPGGNNNDMEEPSASLEAFIERELGKLYSLGIAMGHSFGHRLKGDWFVDIDNDGILEVLKAETDQEINIYHIGLYIKRGRVDDFGTWGTRYVRRYFSLGVGLYHEYLRPGHFYVTGKSSVGTDWGEGGHWSPFNGYVDNHMGINAGAGLACQIWTNYRLGMELRYHRFFREPRHAEYYIPSITFSRLF